MTTRVLLVEDHGLVRAGFRALLTSLPGVDVVAEASNGQDALRLISKLHPDVVLMDIAMPGLNGIETTRRAVKLRPRPRVLVLSMHRDRTYVREALLAGAAGYLLKESDRDELESALAAVAGGQVWLSPSIAQYIVEDVVQGASHISQDGLPLGALTPRQREVLQLLAEGHSTKQIASRLRLSIKTIETHRGQIMSRLDIHTLAGLVRYAIRAGIVAPEP